MSSQEYLVIGLNSYSSVYLIREWSYITLKRMTEKTYDEMEEYIRNSWDLESEWRDDVSNGNTTQGFDSWLEDYEYEYSNYFQYDSVVDIYYDEDDDYCCDDFYIDESKDRQETIDYIMDAFDNYYNSRNMDWQDITYDDLRVKVGEYYDKILAFQKEREEARKPHWSVFSYYK